MSMQEAKAMYTALLLNKDLFVLFTDMTGDWLEDKNKFIRQYEESQELIRNANLDFEDFID